MNKKLIEIKVSKEGIVANKYGDIDEKKLMRLIDQRVWNSLDQNKGQSNEEDEINELISKHVLINLMDAIGHYVRKYQDIKDCYLLDEFSVALKEISAEVFEEKDIYKIKVHYEESFKMMSAVVIGALCGLFMSYRNQVVTFFVLNCLLFGMADAEDING